MPRVLLLMAFTIAASVGASMAAATGRPCQGHAQWAVNQGAYWAFYLTSTQSLSALYSTNGGSSWTAPTGSPFTLDAAHTSEGRSIGFAYANLASTDVLHLDYCQPSTHQRHYRWTLGTAWTNTNNAVPGTGRIPFQAGYPAVCLDSGNKPVDALAQAGDSWIATWNADSGGGTWTPGSSAGNVTSLSINPTSDAIFSIGSGTLLWIGDNGAPGTFTNLIWSTGSAATYTSPANVFGSALSAADANAWGAVARSTSDVHAVALANNSNAYSHARFNGSSWSAGDTVPTLAYGTTSGISLVSDGTSVWAAAIDTSKNIKYCKWDSGTGWGSWTTLESARTNTPAYITGVYSPARGEILWMWTEANGANYDIVGSTLSLAGAPTTTLIVGPFPSLPPAFLAM